MWGVYPNQVRLAPQSHFNSYHPITSRFQHDTWEEGKFVIAFNGVLSASSPTVHRYRKAQQLEFDHLASCIFMHSACDKLHLSTGLYRSSLQPFWLGKHRICHIFICKMREGLRAFRCLWVLSWIGIGGSAGFPVPFLELTQEQIDELNSSGVHDSLATSILLPHLSHFFSQSESKILVEPGDIIIEDHFPDTTIDDDCSHKVEALNGHATGDIKNSSFLTGAIKISWKSASVFVDAELDSKLDIGGDVRVRVGKHIFGHHCTQIARKTMGLAVDSDGKNGVGINMTASNAHLEHVNGTLYLVFNFHADVVGTVLKWNVDKITADGCKIKILGIEIASVCGYVERHVKDKLQSLLNSVERVDAPKILHKLEERINAAIGSVVRIPLKLPLPGAIVI
eukprot:symbB.v1.2.020324.t1/scaffold1699.1/size108456/9